jgi:hypothetical protein
LNKILVHVFSRIDTKWDRIAVEKTCRGNVLFQLSRLLLLPYRNDFVRSSGRSAF